jgi:hypothetical protein
MIKATMMVTIAVWAAAATPVRGQYRQCPSDAVRAGNTCVDKYEESVWHVPPTNASGKDNRKLIEKIVRGEATLRDLQKGSATQLGCADAPYRLVEYPARFPLNGNWIPDPESPVPPSPGVYAVSIPGVLPSSCITWFQAEQACALSGKRLLTNQEWQRAAQGTPDTNTDNRVTDCATRSPAPAQTGSRADCVSAWGARDMVGNVWEWVADWGDTSSGCATWLNDDTTCFGGPGGGERLPAAIMRGGLWDEGTRAGVFAVWMNERSPLDSGAGIGFRCAR